MQYREELQIAKQAEKMLTTALKHKAQRFAEHYYRKQGEASLKDAQAKSKVKRYGKFRDGNQKVFMRSLAIKMPRHGFVQHYGADTIRKAAQRQRTKPKNISYFYKPHPFKMPAQPFINEAIEGSGVVDFVMEKISKLRSEKFTEELMFSIKEFSK